MKRIITLFAAVILVAAGCQKAGESKLDDRLVGTKWQTSDYAHKIIHGGNPYEVYEFVSTAQVDCYTTSGGTVVKSSGTFDYTLTYPKIVIKRKTSDGISTLKYTFKDSRTMVRDGVDESTPYAKYIRQ